MPKDSKERQRGITLSAILHFLFLLFAIFGLPLMMTPAPPEEPQAITVELLPITGITNVKPSDMPISPEEKPDAKKPEAAKKPTPPVKTAENTPAPAPEKPAEKPLDKKADDKKLDDKKDEKKTKTKEEDLEAVLAAVKDAAKKQQKEDKQKDKDDSKNKSRSNQYNDSLPMSLSEKDAIRSQIAKCWQMPIGAKDAYQLVVVLNLQLAEDGSLIKVELASASKDRYNRDSFYRAAADSAMRAVRECSPLKNLPPEKYGTWRDIEMTFDPKEMLF